MVFKRYSQEGSLIISTSRADKWALLEIRKRFFQFSCAVSPPRETSDRTDIHKLLGVLVSAPKAEEALP